MVEAEKYQILSGINSPSDLKSLKITQIQDLSQEIREYLVEVVSKTGGHLGPNLGVVELTIALHYVFFAPKDKIIWDIGHQAYPHKILTGRREALKTIRQPGGISGFCSIKESEYDVFGAGHSSTSISAALGIAIARDLNGDDFDVISVIGDSAMTAGMAYEAINNAGHMHTKLLVILNDNEMSIAPAVGALRNYLAKLIASKSYIGIRNITKNIADKLPKLRKILKSTETAVKDVVIGQNIFEAMGFYYIGPIDGHDLETLITVLASIKNNPIKKPVLLHIKTEKGRGYEPAKAAYDKLHGVNKFDVLTGVQDKGNKLTYTDVFAKTLIHLAKSDDKIVGVTAGMPTGTGLHKFHQEFPSRMFDVAIAEQHAVTFCAGLAISGYKPYCAIYSTFLQRAYDQIIHDVAIQNLPVKFAIDRAGYVGADGATHAGSFDISFLAIVPNMVIMAASSGLELAGMIKLANNINDRPVAFRYPRGEIRDEIFDVTNSPEIELGKMHDVIQSDSKIAIISFGSTLQNAILAVQDLKNNYGIAVSLIDARFAKPLDEQRLLNLYKDGVNTIITVEEGSMCGFGAIVTEFAQNNNLPFRIKQLHMRDEFIEHGTIESMQDKSGISLHGIVDCVLELLKNN